MGEKMEQKHHNSDNKENQYLDSILEKDCKIFLLGGVRLDGILIGYDDHSVIINNFIHGKQLIYKNAISTISMSKI